MEEKTLKKIIQDTAKDTAERMREFHQEDIKVLRESMDVRFETFEQRMNERFDGVETRLGNVETRLDGVESALQTLLIEFKHHREDQELLKKEVEELRSRIQVLEQKLAIA